jgi:hypothetical protein
MMKLKSIFYSLMGLVGMSCLVSLQAIVPGRASADEVSKGCPPPSKANPLRLSANDHLLPKQLKSKAFFTKGLRPDAVFVSFEILTAKKFMKKEPQIDILCDTSLNRQIAVLIVDYPKGYSNGFTDFSKARVTYLFDAQTGGNISDSTSGTPIGGGGPRAVYPSKKKV